MAEPIELGLCEQTIRARNSFGGKLEFFGTKINFWKKKNKTLFSPKQRYWIPRAESESNSAIAMGRDEMQMSEAKRAYRSAKEEGNRQEEARWANVIGDILKNRGEYVEALKWFRIDYDVSVKYLPEKHLLPTCQSLGEVYLRLEHFKDALIYQVVAIWVSFFLFLI